MDREPCPYRIIDDIGGAYLFGAVLGGGFHFLKGFRNSPRGERILGALTAVKARAPVLGGNFAVWGGLFACCDCTMVAIRRKEDPWNAIFSGFATGGILALRAGPKIAFKNAIIGGILLAAIEGGVIMTNQHFSKVAYEERNKRQPLESESKGPTRADLSPPIPFSSFGSGGNKVSFGDEHNEEIRDDKQLIDPFSYDSLSSQSMVPESQITESPNRSWMNRLFGRGK